MDHFFDSFHGLILRQWNLCLVRISPEEQHHSFLLAIARDLKSQKGNAAEWRTQALSSVFRFVPCASAEARFWESAKLREKIGMDYETCYFSAAEPSDFVTLAFCL
jgi:hypothetical protein